MNKNTGSVVLLVIGILISLLGWMILPEYAEGFSGARRQAIVYLGTITIIGIVGLLIMASYGLRRKPSFR